MFHAGALKIEDKCMLGDVLSYLKNPTIIRFCGPISKQAAPAMSKICVPLGIVDISVAGTVDVISDDKTDDRLVTITGIDNVTGALVQEDIQLVADVSAPVLVESVTEFASIIAITGTVHGTFDITVTEHGGTSNAYATLGATKGAGINLSFLVPTGQGARVAYLDADILAGPLAGAAGYHNIFNALMDGKESNNLVTNTISVAHNQWHLTEQAKTSIVVNSFSDEADTNIDIIIAIEDL